MSRVRSWQVLIALHMCAAAALTCSLPLDPYVVALPDSINGVPVNQFDGWVDNPSPDADNNQAKSGYVRVPAGATITWKMYWDPTQGHAQDGAESKFAGSVTPVKTGFVILNGQPPVNLYDLSAAQAALSSLGSAPMKIQEVYDRDSATGGWAASKARVSAPWVIPNNGLLEPIKMDDGTDFNPTITAATSPLMTQLGVNQSSPNFLTSMFGSSPTYSTLYQAPSNIGPGTAGRQMWQIRPGSAGWTAQGGTWEFVDVQGLWYMNVKNTGYTAQPTSALPGASVTFNFNTPSDPFYYLVRPVATFRFNLKTDPVNERYEWIEETVTYDATGNVTVMSSPANQSQTHSLTANGIFQKAGGASGGVPTLVRVEDTSAPLHSHFSSSSFAPAETGGAIQGSAVFHMVDDNPYAGYSGALPTATGPATKFVQGNPSADFYYSMPVNDFAKATGLTDQPSNVAGNDFDITQDTALNSFVYLKERWKWFKSTTTLSGTYSPPYANGASTPSGMPSGIYGNGANPAFSVATYNVPASVFDEPLPIHHLSNSTAQSNPDGSSLVQWQNSLKFFIRPKDASNNAMVLNNGGFTTEGDDPVTPNAGDSPTAKAAGNAGDYITGDGIAKIGGTVSAVDWQPGVPGGCSHDKTNTGTIGVLSATTDKVRPSVVLLVKDTKYNRTYIMNHQEQGWWKRTEAKNALSGGTASSETNVPWTNLVSADTDDIRFDQGGTAVSDFVTQANPGGGFLSWAPGQANGKGLWVDEDTRLLFQVLAWDNVNWKSTAVPSGNIEWRVDNQASSETAAKNPTGSDQPMPDLGNNRFEYVFRDPNRTPGDTGQKCTVEVTVNDPFASGMIRRIFVDFFVASNQLKILTLEEQRQNK